MFSAKEHCTPTLEHRVAKLACDDTNDTDLLHWCSCKLPQTHCQQCKFAVNKSAWRLKCNWLQSSGTGTSWRLKCQVCSSSGMPGEFASGYYPLAVNLSLFTNHARSKCHQDALAIQCGQTSDEFAMCGAPSAQAFADLLGAIRENKATGNSGVAGVGKRHKCRKMKFCLAEARRIEVEPILALLPANITNAPPITTTTGTTKATMPKLASKVRDALSRSMCISIHQDKRDPLLAMRFISCDSKLNITKGVLGGIDVTTVKSKGSLGLRDATLKILQSICTPNLGHLVWLRI